MDEALAILEREFCPPLDPALLYAIAPDFLSDGNANGLENAREALEPIRAAAVVDQDSGFDPSGSSGFETTGDVYPSDAHTESGKSQSAETDLTSLSNGLSSYSISGSSSTSETPGTEYGKEVESLSVDEKAQRLTETFPTVSTNHIKFLLQKCEGHFGRATDELLNYVYFEESAASLVDGEEKVVVKGIEAFSEENIVRRGRKKKGGKKAYRSAPVSRGTSVSAPGSSPSTGTAMQASNKWHTAAADIIFLSSRSKIPEKTIKSLYHDAGGSLSLTIMALLKPYMTDEIIDEEDDVSVVASVVELVQEFPINETHAAALIRLTHPFTASAHELAKALVQDRNGGKIGGVEIIPHYAPINLSANDGPSLGPSKSTASLLSTARSPTASSISVARFAAFNSASAAHRKGKSDPLFKAAASYYGQLGRDYSRALHTATAAEADEIVRQQSTLGQGGRWEIDLHGVSVKDSVRIVDREVLRWWYDTETRLERRGQVNRTRVDPRDTLKIVTGVGHHSEGGRAKVGPAAMKALVQSGWKVEVASGMLTVVGKARR